jgi:hypothetical protein
MTTILQLHTSEPVGDSAIRVLEYVLDQARRGDVSSASIAVVTREGCAETSWSKLNSRTAMLGAITMLQHDIIREMAE